MSYHHFAVCVIIVASGLLQGQQNWEETRRLAEAQHEIVMLLIEKGEFDKVPGAANEIFQLSFPQNQEHLLLNEVEILVDALVHHQRIAIAHGIVDSALLCTVTAKSKAQLYREKGYLYKKEGNAEEALKSFEKSKELEKKE